MKSLIQVMVIACSGLLLCCKKDYRHQENIKVNSINHDVRLLPAAFTTFNNRFSMLSRAEIKDAGKLCNAIRGTVTAAKERRTRHRQQLQHRSAKNVAVNARRKKAA